MKLSYQFKTAAEILALCKKHRKPISEIAVQYEKEHSGKNRSEVMKRMKKILATMEGTVIKGSKSHQRGFLNLAAGDAPKILHSLQKRKKEMFMSPVVLRAMAYATATNETNACMGRIVAFPTAGGAGVVPGVIFGYAHEKKLHQEKILNGLFVASTVGLIIAENATLSAAAGGCQAEVGAAIAMGAAAITEMRGGTPEQCFHASSLGLKSYLGVVCDPLGGLVAVPCIKRNTLGAATAMASSDLAVSGVQSYIPFDEVVEAMWRIGQIMSPKLKETALGGLAVTPTGLKVREKLGLPPLKPVDTPDDQPKTFKPTEQIIHWTDER